jgi:hypothetical protein
LFLRYELLRRNYLVGSYNGNFPEDRFPLVLSLWGDLRRVEPTEELFVRNALHQQYMKNIDYLSEVTIDCSKIIWHSLNNVPAYFPAQKSFSFSTG